MFTWLVVVTPWEQVVRVRAGRRVRVLGAGMYLRIPFVDRLYRQSTRRRLSIIPAQTVTTKDGKAITIGAAVGYSITDLLQLYESIHDAADTIECEVSAVASEYFATHTFAECTPTAVAQHMRSTLDLSRYGLGDTEFHITNFAAVRTLRVITGDIRSWSQGAMLNTSESDSDRGRAL